ncbi:AAA family ATPase [Kineosporia sp. J2-2]|uniref:AAA family ATPase n=1 Tax=Kineosporia corallincola TaxID=2835133 RepID=A0ABS5TC85_9ACTN|nr:AAA family ATPase [Kineosporia corallincola]MBT0768651.1 AAA family ATPase [Kineosporia corallincola]
MRKDARPRVLVLNGGSSSGKTSVARELQEVLDGVWLRLGVDTLIDALPASFLTGDDLTFTADGEVVVGAGFRQVEDRWMTGVAAMARAGAQVLIEDNFVSGPGAQRRWRAALAGLPVGWVGVRCDPSVAAERERLRGDRVPGMAARQAVAVHRGIDYDMEVDTGTQTSAQAAARVRARFFTPADQPSRSGPA